MKPKADWQILDEKLDMCFLAEDVIQSSGIQTTTPLQPNVNDNEEEETDPEVVKLKQHVQQISKQNPSLKIQLNCIGQNKNGQDGRVWYLFNGETTQTATGPQAKKWGGFGTKDVKNMLGELQKAGTNVKQLFK